MRSTVITTILVKKELMIVSLYIQVCSLTKKPVFTVTLKQVLLSVAGNRLRASGIISVAQQWLRQSGNMYLMLM